MARKYKLTVAKEEMLLRMHQEHLGLYERIASSLGVDASYVSRVARGERESPHVRKALTEELARMQQQYTRK
jgi:transcriptional regulator with XRE-family HTH domain